MAVSINQTTLSFFTDAHLQKEVRLLRPVTDCSGRALIIGVSDNNPQMGEITFFPRRVTRTEMEEISQQGFTFESLGSGKLPFQKEKTPFATAAARQSKYFAQAKSERDISQQEMHVENAFTRVETANVAKPPIDAYEDLSKRARITVPAIPNCKTLKIFGSTTSCHIIKGLAANETSPSTGDKKYLNLVPPPYRPAGLSGKDQLLLDHNKVREYLSYDSEEFPSFCQKSATFSMWIENWDTGARSALISRYVNSTSKRNRGAWFYQIDEASGGTSCCIGQIPAADKVAFWKCAVLGPSLNNMRSNTRRHLALVLNQDDNTIKFYLDGVLAETKSSEEPSAEAWIRDEYGGGVGRLDCFMDTPYSYTGLGHRVPGENPYLGPVQDWRYYVGHALTAAEIKAISQENDDDGAALRTCKLPEEGKDSNWKDIYGNDCAWYQETAAEMKLPGKLKMVGSAGQAFPGICKSETLTKRCPVACDSHPPCFGAGERV